jgi:hypothetical protein
MVECQGSKKISRGLKKILRVKNVNGEKMLKSVEGEKCVEGEKMLRVKKMSRVIMAQEFVLPF